MDVDIPRTAKDRIQKMLAALFRETLTKWYDDQLPPVREIWPNTVSIIQFQEHLLDTVFLLEDGTLLDIEFQSTPVANLVRFAQYALSLYGEHRRQVRTLVVYLGPHINRGAQL
jgi:hypothetical protein